MPRYLSLSTFLLVLTLAATDLWAHFPGIDVLSDEDTYKNMLTQNNCLLQGSSVEKAWKHRKALNKIVKTAQDIGFTVSEDGKVHIEDARGTLIGYHWGYTPALSDALYTLIDNNQGHDLDILEVGARLSLDAMAVVKKHKNVKITTVEESYTAVDGAKLIADNLTSKHHEHKRLSINAGAFPFDFLHKGDNNPLSGKTFVVIILAKLLQRYHVDDMRDILSHLTRYLKPGGHILLENGSDQTGKFVVVEVTHQEPLKNPVTLSAIKADHRLSDLALIKQSRLSVMPVPSEMWAIILSMAS